MKTLLTTIVVIALMSCSKSKQTPTLPTQRTDFFKNVEEARMKIQTAFDNKHLNEKIQQIESISYVDGKDKSYAFVFFTSNKGSRNLILERRIVNGQQQMKTTTCEGRACDCKVVTTIANNGDVKIECSCSTCSMVITNLDPDF